MLSTVVHEFCHSYANPLIDAHLDRTMSLVEPIMLVFMAVVVAVMLFSIYYPLIQAYGQSTA